MRFNICFWGTRGTCPSPGPRTARFGGNSSCVEVRTADGHVIVLDAGSGVRALGSQLELEADHRPIHMFLSHLHGDHVLGLPHFAPLVSQDRHVVISCATADAATLRPILGMLLSPPLFPSFDGNANSMRLVDWHAERRIAVGTRGQVRWLRANHPGDAAIIVVEDDLGLAVAYAPDNELRYASNDGRVRAWRDALTLQLRGVPLLIHDATYASAELPAHVGWGHSSADEATRFAIECEAETLLLFHHHPDRQDEAVEQLLAQCRAIASASGSALRVLAAWEGLSLAV